MQRRVPDDELLIDIVDRLVQAYQPRRIYLFGSTAKSQSKPESDYDILIVVADDAPLELRKASKAYSVLWGIKAAVDVLVWTEGDFQSRKEHVGSLPALVKSEGRLLHVA
jgi:uncharacterized protein